MKKLAFAAVALTAGCVTTEKMSTRLNNYRGMGEDAVVELLGAPARHYEMTDGTGTKVLTYKYEQRKKKETLECEVNFKLKGGRVSDATFKGDLNPCWAGIPPRNVAH